MKESERMQATEEARIANLEKESVAVPVGPKERQLLRSRLGSQNRSRGCYADHCDTAVTFRTAAARKISCSGNGTVVGHARHRYGCVTDCQQGGGHFVKIHC